MDGFSNQRPHNGDMTTVNDSASSPASPFHNALSPITSPPYWVQSHGRTTSNISIDSMRDAIVLQDNENGDKNEACWAKSVVIDDHVVVNGSRGGIGAFVVWNITVETLTVSVLEDVICLGD
jgi:hypothetical protein